VAGFRVGDRVRIARDALPEYVGLIGTISEEDHTPNEEFSLLVHLDQRSERANGHDVWCSGASLDPLDVPPDLNPDTVERWLAEE